MKFWYFSWCQYRFGLFDRFSHLSDSGRIPYSFKWPKNFEFYFRFYPGLLWSGLFLFTSMWIDKIIMWTAPEAVTHMNNLRTYPIYDGGMFLSYLSIVPVMALLLLAWKPIFMILTFST